MQTISLSGKRSLLRRLGGVGRASWWSGTVVRQARPLAARASPRQSLVLSLPKPYSWKPVVETRIGRGTSRSFSQENIEDMEVAWMRTRAQALLDVPTGGFNADTWLAADDLLKWWASQRTSESVDMSFQILDHVVQELKITLGKVTTYLDPRIPVTVLQNWYETWEEVAKDQQQPLDLTPEMVLRRMDTYARDLPQTSPIFVPGKTISYVFNATLLRPESASQSAPFCDYLVDRLLEVIPERDALSVYTINTTLDLWAKSDLPDRIPKAEALIARATDHKVELDLITYNTMLSVYANAGLGAKADRLLQALVQDHLNNNNNNNRRNPPPVPDQISMNTVVLAYANSGEGLEAADQASFLVQRLLDPFDDYGQLGIKVTNVIFNTVLLAYSRAGVPTASERAYQVLQEMKQSDLVAPDSISYGTVIDAFSRSRQPEKAEEVFEEQLAHFLETRDESLRPTTVSMTILVGAWSRAKLPDAAGRARDLLDKMVNLRSRQIFVDDPDTWTYNAVLGCILSSTGPKDTFVELDRHLNFMKEQAQAGNENAWPNAWTYSQVILFCLERKKMKRAHNFLLQAHADPRADLDIRTTARVLIEMARIGEVQKADFWLNKLLDICEKHAGEGKTRPTASLLGAVAMGWNRIVDTDPQAIDNLNSLVKRYEDMFEKGHLSEGPDEMVYRALVWSYVKKGGASADALETLQKMRRIATGHKGRPEMMPDTITYGQVVRALVADEEYEKASDLMQQMVGDFQSDSTKFPAPDTECVLEILRGLERSNIPDAWNQAVGFFSLTREPSESSGTPRRGNSKNPIRDRRVFSAMIRLANKFSLRRQAHALWEASQKFQN